MTSIYNRRQPLALRQDLLLALRQDLLTLLNTCDMAVLVEYDDVCCHRVSGELSRLYPTERQDLLHVQRV